MDFQWATPIFHFAILHATPTRRSIRDRSVEICTAPTPIHISGYANGLLSLHESVNDTTCTTQSDYSDHVCHLHSKEACGGPLLPEPEIHAHNTSHRTDAPKHTYHVFSSMHDHTFGLIFCSRATTSIIINRYNFQFFRTTHLKKRNKNLGKIMFMITFSMYLY